MITDTIGQPSPDAAPVAIPGWCHNPRSTPPIHRRADSCTLVECPELVLPAGLVAEMCGPASHERCSCGNEFDGDNLCMVSACQWEGIE